MSDSLYFPDEKMRLDVLEADQLSRKIKARGGRMMAVEVIFKAGAVGYEHQHEHEQISYCLDGEFVFTVDGRNYPLKVGDSVYIPPSAVTVPVAWLTGEFSTFSRRNVKIFSMHDLEAA